MVGALLEEADGGAIALGGGSVLSERVREALGRHTVVWLQVDAEEAWRRIAHSDRPLARSAEDVARLLAERLPLYEELADAVVPPGDRGIVGRALPSIRALAELPPGTRMLWAASASGEYPVFVGRGLLGRRAGGRSTGRRFCVTDTAVGAALRRPARAARRRGSRSSRARGRRRWPRPSGCCASWPAPG